MNFIYPLQGTSSAQERGAGGLELKKLFFDLFVNMLSFFYDLYKLAIHVIFLDFLDEAVSDQGSVSVQRDAIFQGC